MRPPPTRAATGPLLVRPSAKIVIGLLADPDLPEQIAGHLADVLPDDLSTHLSRDVDWTVETADDPFEASIRHERIIDKARMRAEGKHWDIALCLTDMPIQRPSGTTVAMINLHDRVALISLPALGGLQLRRRARGLAITLIDELTTLPSEERSDASTQPLARRRSEASRLTRRATPTDRDIDLEVVMPARRGRLRLLAGIVRANRPWQLTLGLSTALAGAVAGSAFGILYSAIWVMANVLEPWRLTAATVGGIAVLAVWLIVGHSLWEQRPQPKTLGWLVNTATVLTIANGVLVFSLALFAINIIAAGLIIPPHYMAEVLGHPVALTSYLRVALMATVLGTIAGAVGSGLEDDDTVRRAAYSTREQGRRRFMRQQP